MTKKILVVDDNKMVLKFLSGFLTKKGYEVRTCEDGLSALGLLTTYQPDVAFVDLILPKIGGEKLCQIIRSMEHLKNCFLVILSAAVADMELNYSELGINACIAKGPFGQMGTHVLNAIEDSAATTQSQEQGRIRGIDSVGGVPGYARRMTKELLDQTRHLETILGSLNEAIVEVYAGQVVYANSSAAKLFSVPLESLLSVKPLSLFDEAARSRIEVLFDNEREKIPKPVGLTRPLELNGRQIIIRSIPVEGERDTVILLINDVTEQRNLESQLAHTRRMDAIGKIAGGIAHNFNNLFMGIQGNVSVLNQDLEEGDPGFDELAAIERCVEDGGKLTRRLLSFAKNGQYSMALVDLNGLVEKSVGMFLEKEPTIQVNTNFDRRTALVKADSIQIELVLMELFANARQAMAEGDVLTISTALLYLDETFVGPHDLAPGDYLQLCVVDTGLGMDESTAERIFEPFYSTGHITEKNGLGLSSVFGIVKEHRGLITVKSSVDQGTTFFIYLPLAKSEQTPEPAVSSKPALNLDSEKGSGTILMVDDEEVILYAGQIMLTELGYDVLCSDDGESAIRAFKENKDRIDLVILDLIMPDVRGDVVYGKIKALRADVCVILSSGYDMDPHIASMLEGTDDLFIQKPYTLVQLAKQVKEKLAR